MTTVFLSYAHRQLFEVNRLKNDLQDSGYTIWIDHESLPPGSHDWEQSIRKGIKSSQALVFVASPHSASSKYVISELELAEIYHIPVIPIWIEGENWLESAPLSMGRTQYIDARLDYTAAFHKLISALPASGAEGSNRAFQPVNVQQYCTLSYDFSLPFPDHAGSREEWYPIFGISALGSQQRFRFCVDHCLDAWSPDSSRIAITAVTHEEDWKRTLWNTSASVGANHIWVKRYTHIFEVHKGHVRLDESNSVYTSIDSDDIAWSPDGGALAIAGRGEIALVKAHGGERGKNAQIERDSVAKLEWSPDSTQLMVIYAHKKSGTVDILDRNTRETRFSLTPNSRERRFVSAKWSPDGTRIATTSDSGIVIWSAQNTQRLLEIYKPATQGGGYGAISWSPDSTRVAYSGWKSEDWGRISSDKVTVYNAQTTQIVCNFSRGDSKIFDASWSPDGRYVASSAGRDVFIWNGWTGKTIFTFSIPNAGSSAIRSVKWSPNGKYLSTCVESGTPNGEFAHIWELVERKRPAVRGSWERGTV